MGIANFTYDNFNSIDTSLFSYLDKNYKSQNLLAKLKKVLTIYISSILQP